MSFKSRKLTNLRVWTEVGPYFKKGAGGGIPSLQDYFWSVDGRISLSRLNYSMWWKWGKRENKEQVTDLTLLFLISIAGALSLAHKCQLEKVPLVHAWNKGAQTPLYLGITWRVKKI